MINGFQFWILLYQKTKVPLQRSYTSKKLLQNTTFNRLEVGVWLPSVVSLSHIWELCLPNSVSEMRNIKAAMRQECDGSRRSPDQPFFWPLLALSRWHPHHLPSDQFFSQDWQRGNQSYVPRESLLSSRQLKRRVQGPSTFHVGKQESHLSSRSNHDWRRKHEAVYSSDPNQIPK